MNIKDIAGIVHKNSYRRFTFWCYLAYRDLYDQLIAAGPDTPNAITCLWCAAGRRSIVSIRTVTT